MAILCTTNKDGIKIEMPLEIYGDRVQDNRTDENSTYSINNGLITQNIKVDCLVGKRKIAFPLSYNTTCQGVFVSRAPEEMKPLIQISDITLSSFTLTILPHPHDINTTIMITSTGY